MKQVDTNLVHRVLMPANPGADRHPAMLMLHGRGADEEDLLGLAPMLDERFIFISPRAPYPFPYSGGFTWYDLDDTGASDTAMFRSSYDCLCGFIQDILKQYPIDPANFFLYGFSMGTMMSFALSLTMPHLFRGVMANSGYVPMNGELSYRWLDLSSVHFFIAHGLFDPVIPVEMARQTKELFRSSNASWTYKEYPMAHEISAESVSDAARWLNERLTVTP